MTPADKVGTSASSQDNQNKDKRDDDKQTNESEYTGPDKASLNKQLKNLDKEEKLVNKSIEDINRELTQLDLTDSGRTSLQDRLNNLLEKAEEIRIKKSEVLNARLTLTTKEEKETLPRKLLPIKRIEKHSKPEDPSTSGLLVALTIQVPQSIIHTASDQFDDEDQSKQTGAKKKASFKSGDEPSGKKIKQKSVGKVEKKDDE